jgi:hypothetical protein
LLILHKQRHERDASKNDDTQESDVIRYGIASDLVRLSQLVTSASSQPHHEELSPLALYAVYHTVIAYLEMGGKKPSGEHLHGLQELKSLLTLSSRRWKLGGKFCCLIILQSGRASAKYEFYLGVYLKLIEAREAIYSSGL